MAAALEFTGISKVYRSGLGRRERWAVRDFDLRIEAGGIVGFLGPNGAGKTTAIHIALGLTIPTSGSGSLLQQPLGNANTRRRVGFVPENPAFPSRSALDTVRFAGVLNGMSEPHVRARAKQLLDELGLGTEMQVNIRGFSRGMLQRVGLAQALVGEPELLLLDEPTSALDPISRRTVRDILLRARDRGCTVFISSHLLAEIETICDRLVFVNRGKVIRSGTVSDLVSQTGVSEIAWSGGIETLDGSKEPETETMRGAVVPDASVRNALEQIWASGGTLLSVTPKTGNLEDIFLQIAAGEPDER